MNIGGGGVGSDVDPHGSYADPQNLVNADPDPDPGRITDKKSLNLFRTIF